MSNKKKNNKGFTLIELLAVVVILLAISVMAISSISAAIERNKAKQDESKKELLVSYAKLYYDKHKNSLANSTKIKFDANFISEFELTDDDLKDANGNRFTGCITFTSGGKNFKYESDESKCN